MTFEDVKKIRQNPTAADVDNKELSKMIDIAIEKQIPKYIRIKKVAFDTLDYICPCCNNRQISQCAGVWVAGQMFKYCSKCGQALDWSDTE